MRCGNCRESHDTVAEVKSCYKMNSDGLRPVDGEAQWPPSEKQIDYVLGLQKTRITPEWWMAYDEPTLKRLDRDEVSGLITQLKGFPINRQADSEHRDVPAGRYALYMSDSAHQLRWLFFEVQDGKNRWKGYKFIKRLIGAPGDYQKSSLGREDRATIMKLIERDPKQAMIDYGLQSGVCGVCSSPLTNEESLRRGIGPICASKTGWGD